MRAKSVQLCLTLCDPMDCSPPGSFQQSGHRFHQSPCCLSQVRHSGPFNPTACFLPCFLVSAVLSRFSGVQLFVTPWTVVLQSPLSVGFFRQEYWSGLTCPSPGDLPDPGSNLGLPHCRQTLYHLSHQGCPSDLVSHPNSILRHCLWGRDPARPRRGLRTENGGWETAELEKRGSYSTDLPQFFFVFNHMKLI